jgi:glycosyltransferase involved in cell wall biosynthesis
MNKGLPIVSVGMPVYNGENFIREAIDSLLNQSFSNFELIISDNASYDATEAICLDYQESDKRVRYIRQTENIGVLANFQVVLNESRSEYFMWAACDDIWDSSWIELLLEQLIISKSSAAFGRVKQIDEFSKVINHASNRNFFKFSGCELERAICFFLEFEGKGKANLFYSLYKRNLLAGVNLEGYSQDYYALFDWLNRTKFMSIDKTFLYKRIHNSNAGLIKTKSNSRFFLEVITLKSITNNFFVALGYLKYSNGLAKLILILLTPIKILNSHIFYIQRILKKLFEDL